MVLIERDVVRGRYDAWKLTAYRFVSPKRPAPACPFATVRRPLYGELLEMTVAGSFKASAAIF